MPAVTQLVLLIKITIKNITQEQHNTKCKIYALENECQYIIMSKASKEDLPVSSYVSLQGAFTIHPYQPTKRIRRMCNCNARRKRPPYEHAIDSCNSEIYRFNAIS